MTRIGITEQGLELRGAGPAMDVPWVAIGQLQVVDGRLRIHLADGRVFDAPEVAEVTAVLKAWRAVTGPHSGRPHDAVPVEFRRAAAARVDLGSVSDAPPQPESRPAQPPPGIYRAGLSSTIVDEQGLVVVRPRKGRLRIPWRAVRNVTAVELTGLRSKWVVRVRLYDRTDHMLPAPSTRKGPRDPEFQRALGEIAAALRASRPAPGEPADHIGKRERRQAAKTIRYE
ncbi:hypothetical protein KDL01_12250 [Actinospica durhamensis]|uniref:Uncharacterized protein n=1 Tax=Actinospica durhamensis TaxID=1508375 RepID=A0A941IQB8_9ACTN|nr:hypothetical protein [Actinospica durhamensis]MBR7834042.1 hypothetical protein [Actinospica durhamensis]